MKPAVTDYVNSSTYGWIFTENIKQSVRYITKIRREAFSDNSKYVCQK